MSSFSFDCPYCQPTETLISVTCPNGVPEIEWRRHWKSVVLQPTCPCGAVIRIASDDVPVESGGSVSATNISSPRIDSLTVTSGSRTGGEALYILGEALDVGNLVVKFGGRPAQAVTNRTATQARVVTPVGVFALPGAAMLHRVRLTNLTGTMSVGSTLNFTDGSRATIRHVDGPTAYWVRFTVLKTSLAVLAGQVASGPTGSGPVAEVTAPSLIPGEGLTGMTSGARGAYVAPFSINAPSGVFAASEVVRGDASGSCALLGSPAISGLVDVTVENEYGRRHTGGTLVGGFTYL
jgi:hypothetical protein